MSYPRLLVQRDLGFTRLHDAQRTRGPFAWQPLIDLVDDGNTWDETVQRAQALEAAGVMMFNSCYPMRMPTAGRAGQDRVSDARLKPE